jgi:hypothetical protein
MDRNLLIFHGLIHPENLSMKSLEVPDVVTVISELSQKEKIISNLIISSVTWS